MGKFRSIGLTVISISLLATGPMAAAADEARSAFYAENHRLACDVWFPQNKGLWFDQGQKVWVNDKEDVWFDDVEKKWIKVDCAKPAGADKAAQGATGGGGGGGSTLLYTALGLGVAGGGALALGGGGDDEPVSP